MEINTTRSIAAQILRHRSFSFQEFSQRYSDVSIIGSPAIPALRRQDPTNRQNSIDDFVDKETSCKLSFEHRITRLFAASERIYLDMLKAGIAKECAREVLPLATPTRLYMAGSIRSWLHYIDLRAGNGTQKEHQDIALECKQILAKELPTITAAMWTDED